MHFKDDYAEEITFPYQALVAFLYLRALSICSLQGWKCYQVRTTLVSDGLIIPHMHKWKLKSPMGQFNQLWSKQFSPSASLTFAPQNVENWGGKAHVGHSGLFRQHLLNNKNTFSRIILNNPELRAVKAVRFRICLPACQTCKCIM